MNGNKIAKTKTNRRTKRTDETTGSLFRLLVASTNVSVAARNGSAKHSLQNDNRNNNWNFDKRKKLYLKCERLLNTEPMNRISQVLKIKHGVGLEQQRTLLFTRALNGFCPDRPKKRGFNPRTARLPCAKLTGNWPPSHLHSL